MKDIELVRTKPISLDTSPTGGAGGDGSGGGVAGGGTGGGGGGGGVGGGGEGDGGVDARRSAGGDFFFHDLFMHSV